MARAYCDAENVPAAYPYFSMFPREPVLTANAQRTFMDVEPVNIHNMTVYKLLQTIRKNNDKDVMIVAHGRSTQLSIPIADKIEKALDEDAVSVFLDNQQRMITNEEAARRFKIAPKGFIPLRDELSKVREMGIDKVVIRACLIGQSESLLEKLKLFFRCKSICAPKNLDLFARVDPGSPTSDDSVWQSWLHKYKDIGAVVEGAKPRRFALYLKILGKTQTQALADSWEAVGDWVKTHLPGDHYQKGQFYIHAVVGDQPPSYPMDLNPDYLQHFVLK